MMNQKHNVKEAGRKTALSREQSVGIKSIKRVSNTMAICDQGGGVEAQGQETDKAAQFRK